MRFAGYAASLAGCPKGESAPAKRLTSPTVEAIAFIAITAAMTGGNALADYDSHESPKIRAKQ
jgi:hypothetical protein